AQPVPMTATCNRMRMCVQLLKPQGHLLSWPPASQLPPAANFHIEFGYAEPGDYKFEQLFACNYQPVSGQVSGGGPYLPVARDDSRCVGYDTTIIPATLPTTVRCVDKQLLTGTLQSVDAYFASPELTMQAMNDGLPFSGGVLFGQVRRGNS